jgi:hypothetical protein
MYPAEGFSAGSYSVEDLPDEILIAGVLAQKQQDGYPRYTSQNEEFTVTDPDEETPPEDALWQVMIFGESFYELDCLISSYKGSAEFGIEDQFADSYTMSGGPLSFSVTVTRVSLCIWRGEDGCGNMAYLVYGDDSSLPFAGTDYEWSVALPFYDPTLVCENIAGRTVNGKENQNTPAGVYESIPGQPLGQTITVS